MCACVLAPCSLPAELVLKFVQLLAALAQLQLQAVLPNFQLALQVLGAPGGQGQAPAKLFILLLQQPGRGGVKGKGASEIEGPSLEPQAGQGGSRDGMKTGN